MRKKDKALGRERRAFTLIELLVVVAIIAVLFAILMPSLAKARDTAKGINCKGNLKSVGSITMMYADERGGVLPACVGSGYWFNWSFTFIQSGYSPNSVKGELMAQNATIPYSTDKFVGISKKVIGESRDVFSCASLSLSDLNGTGADFYANAYGTPLRSMGNASDNHQLSKLRFPSTLVLAYDGSGFSTGSNTVGSYKVVGPIWGAYWSGPGDMLAYLGTRHSGKANTLHADGHASGMRLAEVTIQSFPSHISDL